jgi:hypothetical protein
MVNEEHLAWLKHKRNGNFAVVCRDHQREVAMKKMIGLMCILVGFAMPVAADVITVVDSLGAATPSTQFSVFGTGGRSIFSSQFSGPEFTLTASTVLTEIGGFVNNCKSIIAGVPQCPITLPFVVQIHPSLNGVPDPSTVIASFVLSHDNDPLVVSYEFAAMNFTLAAGTYFALFAPQGSDAGFLLGTATDPFPYQAGIITLGVVRPGDSFTGERTAAVRILGIPSELLQIDIKPGSFPNTINPKSQGMIPVAILTTETFDATAIDPRSVHFGPKGATEAHGKGHIEDVNHDGEPDLVLHFRTQETGIQCGDTSASLTGETFNEEPIQGADMITTVGCKP